MTTEPLRAEILREIASDKKVADVFHGTNFGAERDERKIIADTLLKIAGGYHSGHTALMCCKELGLLKRLKKGNALTPQGKKYLFWAYTS